MKGLREVIFFEKQESRLCAQHALNMLLQGPYFSADALADIANDLDDREKQMLSPEARKRFQSQNLDDSGFFSLQVITVALQRLWDLRLIPLPSPNLKEYEAFPEKANAYICNLHEHWFVLRKFGKQWYMLNSIKKGPETISDGYLAIYLKQLHTEKYAIFYVDGRLPDCPADEKAQEMLALEEATKSVNQPNPSAPPMNEMDENEQLDLAIALSLSEAQKQQGQSHVSDQPSTSPQPPAPDIKNVETTSTQPSSSKSEAELLRERRENFLKRLENNG